MSELSFQAVILTGNLPAENGREEAVALQRSLDLFYDAGVEDIFVAANGGGSAQFLGRSVLHFSPHADANEKILGAAQAMRGTHLLVFESAFQEMDPNFIIRLIQMSCLGMGVLPCVGEMYQPLVACYPVAIRTLAGLIPLDDHEAGILSLEALNRGLVARYQVPSRDALLFDRA